MGYNHDIMIFIWLLTSLVESRGLNNQVDVPKLYWSFIFILFFENHVLQVDKKNYE